MVLPRPGGRLRGGIPPIATELALEGGRHVAAPATRPGDLVHGLDELLGQQEVRAHVHAHTIAHACAHIGRGPRRPTIRPMPNLDRTDWDVVVIGLGALGSAAACWASA